MNIYIARHGQNEDNANGILNGHRDLPLTELGIQQAHELAEGIKDKGIMFDTVISSPLIRATKTAEIICDTLDLGMIIVLDNLIERDFGTMTGQRVDQIELLCAPDIIKAETVTYFLSPEGGETFPQLLERASWTLEQIQNKYPGESVLVSTHGDFGKMLYAAYYNLPWRDILTRFHFGNCELLLLSESLGWGEPHVIKIDQHNG